MNIRIEKLTKYDFEIFNLIAKWENDIENKAFIIPKQDEQKFPYVDPNEMLLNAKNDKNRFIYIIYDEQKPIGNYIILKEAKHILSKYDKILWFSIIIGDKSYRRCGVGRKAINHLENTARNMGFEYIEIGVFEFNNPARKLYESLGYKTFTYVENFVYYKNKWWSDIRMLKRL